METSALLDYIEENTERYIAFLADICSFEANAYDKRTLDGLADFITRFAIGEGFSVRRTPFAKCGDFLSVEMNADSDRGALFMAHADTVFEKGAFGSPAVKRDGNVMSGPGVIDCKGGIAIALLVMKSLLVCGYKKHLRLLITSDEEISTLLGGKAEVDFFREESRGFPVAFNCETTENNNVVVARKGIMRYVVEVRGVGGHSGKHYFEAKNPILECANKIVALHSESKEGGITYSCNVFNAGSAGNVIPDTASFTVDIRVPTLDDMNTAKETLRRICEHSYIGGTSASLTIKSVRPPMQPDAATDRIFEELRAVSLEYGLGELTPVRSGGGSDSAYTQMSGVPSVCGLGGSGDFAHTVREYINLPSIPQRAKLLSLYLSKQ